MNIHQLYLNRDTFSRSSNLGNRKWKCRHFGAEIYRDQEKRENPPPPTAPLWNKSRRQFSYAARCFMPKIVSYQTTPVWFVNNEYCIAKINVYHSLPSDRVIGLDIKNDITSEFNCNFYKQSGSPNLATIAKFGEIVKIGSCTQLLTLNEGVSLFFLNFQAPECH